VQQQINSVQRSIVGLQTNFPNTSLLIIGLASKLPFSSFFNRRLKSSDIKDDSDESEIDVSKVLFNQIGCASDVGKVRPIDEDSVLIAKVFSASPENSQDKVFMVVADGMGGHSKGEVASAIGVSSVAKSILPKLYQKNDLDYAKELATAILSANVNILNYALDHPECEGMGTTMTAAVVDSKKIKIAHVGDTRAYLFSNEKIRQLTKDHSFVQGLIDKGEITSEEARTHPQKNVITRVVGYYKDVEVDTYEAELQSGDQILMCCDGLINHVNDSEIAEVIKSEANPGKACERLISMANDRGGKDNISVILTSKYCKLKGD
jgi:PPM family protein phosphatase